MRQYWHSTDMCVKLSG